MFHGISPIKSLQTALPNAKSLCYNFLGIYLKKMTVRSAGHCVHYTQNLNLCQSWGAGLLKKVRWEFVLIALSIGFGIFVLGFYAGRNTLSTTENGGLAQIYLERIPETSQAASVPEEPVSTPDEDENVEKVNLNTASKEELMALPGVGETLADRILEYRNMHGIFYAVEELLGISGIGTKKLDAIATYVTVEEVYENSGS